MELSLQKISQMPELVRKRRYFDEHGDFFDDLVKKWSLTPEKRKTLLIFVQDAIAGLIPFADFATEIQKRTGLDIKAAQEITVELLGGYFIFFQEYLGPTLPLLEGMEVDTRKYRERAAEILSPKKEWERFVVDYCEEIGISPVTGDATGVLFEAAKLFIEKKISLEDCKKNIEAIALGGVSDEDARTFKDQYIQILELGEITQDCIWYMENVARVVLEAKHIIYEEEPPLDTQDQERLEAREYIYWYYRTLWLFSGLPRDVRDTLREEVVQQELGKLGEVYDGIPFKTLTVKILTGQITEEGIGTFLLEQRFFSVEQIGEIKATYSEKVLSRFSEHLKNLREKAPQASTVIVSAPAISKEETKAPSSLLSYSREDYESFARDLLETSGIVLTDPALVARFVALMVTRLRGIRDGIETREKLEAPVDKGGVGLSRAQTDLLRKNANSLIADIHAGKAVVRKKETISQKEAVVPTQETAPTPAQNTPSQAEKEAAAQKWEEKAKQELASLEQKKSEAPQQAKDTQPSADTSTAPTPPPAFEAPKPVPITGRSRTNATAFGVTGYTAPAQAQPKKPEEQQSAKTSTTSSSHNAIPTPTDLSARSTVMSIEEIDGIPTIVERPASSSKGNATPLTPRPRPRPQQGAQKFEKPGVPINVRQGAGDVSPYKVSVADVTFKPTLVDPIQELKLFTIKDFRRLSKDPHQAAKRIFQKIKLLEQESQTKKAQGIQSWKESEVAKLYAEIGSESFGKGLPLDTVIASRRQAGKETLSEDELDALLELNEMLRF